MIIWNLLSDVAYDWFANTFFALSIGMFLGLFLANAYHTVRCNRKVHCRNWFKELMGKYDK